MTEVFDINEMRKKAIRRFVLHIVLLSILILGSVTGLVLSLVLSKLDYLPNLIINIVLSALLIAFIVFYFFNLFPLVLYYYRLYRGINEVALEKRRSLIYVEEKPTKIINNVKHRVLEFSYREGEEIFKEDLYVLDSDVSFKERHSYRIQTYHNVIVRYEESNHATD